MKLNKNQQEIINKIESDSSIVKVDQSRQEENNHFILIESISKQHTKNNKITYGYFDIIMCKHCGNIKVIAKGNLKNQVTCRQCNSNKYQKEFVGFENLAFKVLKFVKQNKDRKLYYEVQCKNCGKTLVMRKESIINATKCHCAKCKGNGRVPTEDVVYNVYMGNYKRSALSRGFDFNLTLEEFKMLVSGNCHYCGALPTDKHHLKRYLRIPGSIKFNGIDRIDSNLGYNIKNCVSCCEMCNRMKLDYTKQDFLEHVEKIYKFHKSATTIENPKEDK